MLLFGNMGCNAVGNSVIFDEAQDSCAAGLELLVGYQIDVLLFDGDLSAPVLNMTGGAENNQAGAQVATPRDAKGVGLDGLIIVHVAHPERWRKGDWIRARHGLFMEVGGPLFF